MNYLVCIISFFESERTLTWALYSHPNTSSGDIGEWCLEDWQVKKKIEENVLGRWGKKELDLKIVSKAFLYISFFRSFKILFCWKEGREALIPMSWTARLCVDTPGIDSCQLGEEFGFSVFYYCGFLGWAAGCLIMIKTIIILHNYVLSFASTWVEVQWLWQNWQHLPPCWGATPKGLEIQSEVTTANFPALPILAFHPEGSGSEAHRQKQRVLLNCPCVLGTVK